MIQMTPEIHDLGSDVETRLSEVARSHGRTMEAEAAGILTAISQGRTHDREAVMNLFTAARRKVSKEALAPPTQVDFTPDGY
ncbi:hypothetical protein ASJ30_07720 [Janibacter indicus]|uniref:Plasmid stability protein n=1 Tax=Janibacter indicus TaxID=857417 RepID=A0A1L3MGS5_9MICO|nr:hypothetical protein [Janibacter indicus]APH01436.1 hypothetical protein ASJ30_07720 [Janibacter indicus]